MKFTLLPAMLLCAASSLYAQKEIPDFGNFDNSELFIKECSFDKNADAIILFDNAISNYNDEHNLVTERHIRFKILKEKGISRATIEIPYYTKDEFETISGIKAMSCTVDDNGTPVMKELSNSSIFKQKINDRISVMKFTLPNVKVSSIIDYKFESTMKSYSGLEDWYFQSDMPIILSSYSLTMLPNVEFEYVVHKKTDIPVNINYNKNDGSIKFEMSNLAGLREEPYMAAARDYLQRVEFQLAGYKTAFGSDTHYMTTWKELAKELSDASYFGKPINHKLSKSDIVLLPLSNLSLNQKMNVLYEYVKKNFTWNGIDSKYADDGLEKIWSTKKGTSGEINLLLINLLKLSGLEVYPLLVSERSHGSVNTSYPILDQFNKVVAYVIIDNKTYVLDACSENTPVNMIPFDLLNTSAFIVSTKNGSVIQLVDQEKKSHQNYILIESNINEDGIVNGDVNIQSSGYARINRTIAFQQSKETFIKNYFEKNYQGIKLDSFEVGNADVDTLSFDQRFKFTMPGVNSGNYKLINTNLFSELEKNPFISDNRFTNIEYGCRHVTTIDESFLLPANLKPEELPKNIQLQSPDKSISLTRVTTFNNNSIDIQLLFFINKPTFTPDEYPMVKEFFKRMDDVLNEQLVLTKK